jgi:hypothetical protein
VHSDVRLHVPGIPHYDMTDITRCAGCREQGRPLEGDLLLSVIMSKLGTSTSSGGGGSAPQGLAQRQGSSEADLQSLEPSASLSTGAGTMPPTTPRTPQPPGTPNSPGSQFGVDVKAWAVPFEELHLLQLVGEGSFGRVSGRLNGVWV